MPNDLTRINTKPPAGYITVTLVDNPLSQDHRLSCRLMAGPSLRTLIEVLVPDEATREHLSAFVGGDYVPPHLWGSVRPKAGSSVFLKAVPGDPISLLAALAPIAGNAVAAGLGFAAGKLAYGLVSAGVAFAILAVGQALFGPSQSEGQFDEKPTFSITGARNQLTPFAPVPVVLGTHRHVPPYGAAPYTEVVNGQQYLRFVVVWGYGPVDVQNIRIGNTPISDFEDVEVENDFDGTATDLGLYPSVVDQENLSIRLDDTYQTRTTSIETNEIGITVTFPSGLVRFNDKGNRKRESVSLSVQYRKVGDATWIDAAYSDGSDVVAPDDAGPIIGSIGRYSLFDGLRKRILGYSADELSDLSSLTGYTGTAVISDDTAQVVRWSLRITGLELGQYEVRIKREEAEQALSNDRIRDRVDWTALRSFNTEGNPILLEGIAKSAYRIKASDQLNGVVDQLNGIVSTKIPIWTGTQWDESSTGFETITSNPAAIYRYVLTGVANARPVDSANVDDAGLGAWYETCEAEGYQYDAVIDFSRPIRDLLQDIANAGKASPAYIDDQWTVIEEKPRTALVQHFTPRNTRNFSGAVVFPVIPQALRIRFVNEEKDYLEDERTVYDDSFNASNATEFEVIDLPGQTNPANVYKLGRHYLASARLRPERFTFEVDVEHLVVTRGDLCRLTHDVALIGQQSGRIVGFGTDEVILDEPVTIVSGQRYTLRVRADDGTSYTSSFRATSSFTGATIPAPTGDLLPDVQAGDLYMFGEQALESIEVLVAGIEYLDDLAARVTCVPYSPAIYDSADTIPPYESNLSDSVSVSFTGPPRPTIAEIVTDEDALFKTAAGDLEPRILIYAEPGKNAATSDGTVTQTVSLQARIRRSNRSGDPYQYSPIVDVDTDYIEFREVSTGESYTVQVRAIGPQGETSAWVSRSEVTVLGALSKPAAVNTFGINTIGDHTYVEWTHPDQEIDVVGYEIRYHPDQDVTLWSSMTALSDEVPRAARSFTVPSRKGSYAIKAIDVLGNKSEAALFINASLEDPRELNAVQTYVEDPAFTGTKTDVAVVDGALQLGSTYVMADWTTLSDVSSLTYGIGDGFDIDATGIYEFGETDIGSVQTSRITADLNVGILSLTDVIAAWTSLSAVATLAGTATGDDTSVRMEIAYSLDDVDTGPSYSDWRRFVVGDYTARHVKFRLILETADQSQSPTVDALTVNIDMPDEIRQGSDISSGSGTASVTFSPAFYELTSVSVAAQDLQQGDYYEITSKSRTGFDITFRDSGGSAVDRTFDYVSVGYGRERGT